MSNVSADLFQHAATPVVLVSVQAGEVSLNAAFRALFRLDGSDRVLALRQMPAWFSEHLQTAIADGVDAAAVRYASVRVAPEYGQEDACLWVDLDFSPVFDSAGRWTATLLIVTDRSDDVAALKSGRRLEAHQYLALAGQGMVGTSDMQFAKRLIRADARFAELFAISPHEAAAGLPMESFIRVVDLLDRERVRNQIEIALATRSAFNTLHRVERPDGAPRWVAVSAWPSTGTDGTEHYTAIAIDVSEGAEGSLAQVDNELRFRVLMETLPVIVWSSDGKGQHAYFNQRWYEFTGVSHQDVDSSTWTGLVHPEDRERVLKQWGHCVCTGELYDTEYRFRHRSGVYRWLRVMAQPLYSHRGEMIHWVGTSTDIHDAKLLANQRQLIAGEMSHRVKNFFSVIQALIVLSSAKSPSVQTYARKLASRFSALSRAYDVNRPPGERGQSFEALVRRMLDAYEDTPGSRVQVEGCDLRIDDVAANTLCLLLHELATNAAKYGAFSNPEGRVRVRLDLADEQCFLTWKEVGGPAPRIPQANDAGFGSRLLTSCVENQLKGTMHKEWESDGLRFVAEFPRHAVEHATAAPARSEKMTVLPH